MNKEEKGIILLSIGLLIIAFIVGLVYQMYLKTTELNPAVFCLATAELNEQERAIWQQEAALLINQIRKRGLPKESQCSIEEILLGDCLETDTSALEIRLGGVYSVLAQPDKALDQYRQVLINWDQDPEFWKLMANEEMTLCHYQQAKNSLTRALDLAPGDLEIWDRLIFIEQNSVGGTRQSIRRVYREALAATDDNLSLMVDWARWLEMQGEFREAIEVWEEMIDLYPEQEEAIEREIKRIEGGLDDDQ